jgi:hypothetical protein
MRATMANLKFLVNQLSQSVLLERHLHACQEVRLLLGGGHPQALERVVEPDIGVSVAGVICVEVEKCPRFPQEGAALALPQLGSLAQFRQQRLHLIEVFRCGMPHRASMPERATDRKSCRYAPSNASEVGGAGRSLPLRAELPHSRPAPPASTRKTPSHASGRKGTGIGETFHMTSRSLRTRTLAVSEG